TGLPAVQGSLTAKDVTCRNQQHVTTQIRGWGDPISPDSLCSAFDPPEFALDIIIRSHTDDKKDESED
ncbi:hypothetical protein BHE90_006448, partial [Fusarium euwallaceae]